MKLKRAALAAPVLAVALLATAGPVGPARATSPADVECIAHRGGNRWTPAHTEETADTYAAAIAAGVAEVEGDVHWSSTGYPYLLHDATMGLFAHPSVTLASISGTTATGPTYVSATGDQILSLYALRTMLVASPATRAQIELKTVLTDDQWTMLATRLDAIRGRVTITSFNRDTVQAAQVHGYRTGLLSGTPDVTTEAPTFVQDFATLDADDVAAHALVGVATQVYTPDTIADWNAAAAAGVTAIITDDPIGCATWATGPTSPAPSVRPTVPPVPPPSDPATEPVASPTS